MSTYHSTQPARPAYSPGTTSAQSSNRSDFVADLNEAVRQNPLPAALIGAGIAWLFFGRTKDARLGAATGSLLRGAGSGARWAGETTAHGLQAGASGIAAGASEIGTQVRRAATASADALGMAGSKVASSVQGVARSAGERMSSATSFDTDPSDQFGSERGASYRDVAETAQRSVADLHDRQPLLVGAAALAIGAALAACMRTTETERSLMGEAAGSVMGEAKKRWEGAVDEVKAMAGGETTTSDPPRTVATPSL